MNRRSILVAVGVVSGLFGLAGLVLGGLLVGAHASERDRDGFYSTGAHTLSTQTPAFVSDELDVGTNGPQWLFRKSRLATIRVTAQGTDAKPVFIGIARKAQVAAYLHGIAHDEITDFEVDPFSVSRRRHDGTFAAIPPTDEHFWAAATSGNGRQDLRWPVREGSWDVVVMNADGSSGVTTGVSVGAKVPLILWLGIGLLVAGAIFLIGGGTAGYFGGRRRSEAVHAPEAVSVQPSFRSGS